MNVEEQLSQISSIYTNCKHLQGTEDQYVQLTFRCKGYKEKFVRNSILVETSLCDCKHSQQTLFHGAAGDELKKIVEFEYNNIDQMIVQLQKWKLVYYPPHQNYILVVYEFKFLGTTPSLQYDCIAFNMERDLQQSKKLRLSIQRQQPRTPEPMSHKKVKIENFLQKPQMQDSFHLNESLLNNALQSNPQPSSTKKNVFESTKISAMYQGQSKWVLEGRVIIKTDILQFKSKKTDSISNYFKITILDCEQEIISGLFYEQALAKHFEKIKVNGVYFFKNGAITQDKQDGSKKITFNEFSIIEESQNFAIPQSPQLNIMTIQEIMQLQHKAIVDLTVVVQEIKFSDETRKTLSVLDQTGRINLTLWGQQYQQNEIVKGQILVFKGLSLNASTQFKTLNTSYQTVIINDNEIPQVKQLKNWLIGKDLSTLMKPVNDTTVVTIKQVQDLVQRMVNECKTDAIQPKYIYGYIMEIMGYNTMYPSCPTQKCLAKMEQVQYRNTFRCKKCNTENDHPKYRYILKVSIMDETATIKATIFDENAVKLIGMTADQFKQMSEQEQRDRLTISSFRQKKMKLSIQFKEFNGATQPQYQVQDIEDIDYSILANATMEIYEDLEYLMNISMLI